MPMFYIETRNAEVSSRDEGSNHDAAERALALGVEGALGIAVDEIQRGGRSASVLVNIEDADGTNLLSSVVSVCVAPLKVD